MRFLIATTGSMSHFRPALLKIGVAMVLSCSGFVFFRLKAKRIEPAHSSACERFSVSGDDEENAGLKDDILGLQIICSSFDVISLDCQEEGSKHDNAMADLSLDGKVIEEDDGCLLPDVDDPVKEFDTDPGSTTVSSSTNDAEICKSDVEIPEVLERDDYEEEITQLRSVVRAHEERERCLEIQLIFHQGLKEQETAVMELQTCLKLSNMETRLLTLTIESLQTDNQRLEAQVAKHAEVSSELETARIKFKSQKKKLKYDAERNKDQIMALQQKVAGFLDKEKRVPEKNPDLPGLKDLEMEAKELRELNKRLELENSELLQRLESTQILETAVLEDQEERSQLKEENRGLSRDVDTDVEELVYLRWINACLRHKLQNFGPQPGKIVPGDPSKFHSPLSEETAIGDGDAGPLYFDSDHWLSPLASDMSDSGEPDEPSREKSTKTRKKTFFSKLRKLVPGKVGRRRDKVHCAMDKQETSPMYSSGFSTVTDVRSMDSNGNGKNTEMGSSPASGEDGDRRLAPSGERPDDDELPSRKSVLVKYAGTLKGTQRVLGKLRRRSGSTKSC